jgi:hypothetical protein
MIKMEKQYGFNIGNCYGGLIAKEENGKFYWCVEGYLGDDWEEIPESLFNELVKYSESI